MNQLTLIILNCDYAEDKDVELSFVGWKVGFGSRSSGQKWAFQDCVTLSKTSTTVESQSFFMRK